MQRVHQRLGGSREAHALFKLVADRPSCRFRPGPRRDLSKVELLGDTAGQEPPTTSEEPFVPGAPAAESGQRPLRELQWHGRGLCAGNVSGIRGAAAFHRAG